MCSQRSSQGLGRSHPEASARAGSWAEGKGISYCPASICATHLQERSEFAAVCYQTAFCRSCSMCTNAWRHHQGMEMGGWHPKWEADSLREECISRIIHNCSSPLFCLNAKSIRFLLFSNTIHQTPHIHWRNRDKYRNLSKSNPVLMAFILNTTACLNFKSYAI